VEGVELAESEKPNVIILDLGLPDMSGFDVLKQIRLFSSVPLVVLTVRTEEDNIFKALELGADDYIVKPCGRLELLARISVRTRGSGSKIIGGLPIYIFHCLMKNAGQVVTYSKLAEETWGDNDPGILDSLRVHIRRLRQKVELDPDHPQFIVTKPGAGYSLAKQ